MGEKTIEVKGLSFVELNQQETLTAINEAA